MKAIVRHQYGSPEVLKLVEVDKPIPKDNEVLIKINATMVTAASTMIRKGAPYIGRLFLGFFKPKNPIPGTGFAGEIEAIGKEVKQFKIGDPVFGETTLGFSTHAEYVCVAEDGVIVVKPSGLTFEEAAPMTDGPLTSMNFLRDMANVQPGQKVLINGASGSLGTAAVQLAKHFGAEVTGVCGPTNQEMVKSLGADHVVDYTKTDFVNNGVQYDVIYDTVGKSSFSKCKSALTENGLYLSPVLDFSLLLQVMWTSMFGKKKAMFSATGIRPEDELRSLLEEVKELFIAGKIKSVIDKRFSLEGIPDAHRYVDTGRKRGNVVVTVN